MPIDASIYNAFAPKVQSPMDVQNGLAQNALAQGQMQSQQLHLQSQRDALANAPALQAQHDAEAQAKLEKLKAETQQAAAHAGNFDADSALKKLHAAREGTAYLAQKVPSLKTDEDIANWYKEGVQRGVVTPDQAMAEIQKVPPAGPQREAWKADQAKQGMTVVEQMTQALNTQKQQEQVRQFGVTSAQTASHNKSTEGASWAHVGIAKEKLKMEQADHVGGAEGLSPASIENAAARYNVDGTLPPMGMGKSGSEGRRAILNRAAELNMGTSGTDQRIAQMDAKAAGGALNQLTKSKTMNAAFEKTANANAEIALGLSDKLPRTGMPLLNGAIQAVRAGTGSPEATQFAAANETFVAEYAKIMSGGMGNGPVSDAARGKAEKLLTTAMTAEQYKGNVRLLQREMGNRMKGFDDEEKALRGRLGGKTETPSATPAAGAYSDAEKEKRYQEWKAKQK